MGEVAPVVGFGENNQRCLNSLGTSRWTATVWPGLEQVFLAGLIVNVLVRTAVQPMPDEAHDP
jgi:hypothetical protein